MKIGDRMKCRGVVQMTGVKNSQSKVWAGRSRVMVAREDGGGALNCRRDVTSIPKDEMIA